MCDSDSTLLEARGQNRLKILIRACALNGRVWAGPLNVCACRDYFELLHGQALLRIKAVNGLRLSVRRVLRLPLPSTTPTKKSLRSQHKPKLGGMRVKVSA